MRSHSTGFVSRLGCLCFGLLLLGLAACGMEVDAPQAALGRRSSALVAAPRVAAGVSHALAVRPDGTVWT
ncbi:hypothetical protein [Corallococcus exercitus]|uniref:hypothetical protein n=1 Tax=Corallococcus exercitus TaxID=2316736 RepID=UPI001315976E|nr:hypothetical protein [Corallococcus exercitus]